MMRAGKPPSELAVCVQGMEDMIYSFSSLTPASMFVPSRTHALGIWAFSAPGIFSLSRVMRLALSSVRIIALAAFGGALF